MLSRFINGNVNQNITGGQADRDDERVRGDLRGGAQADSEHPGREDDGWRGGERGLLSLSSI